MSSIAATMIQHNVWANLRLVDFLATLDPTRLTERSAGTYGDILSTMIHIAAAERSYLSALSGVEAEGPRSDRAYALSQLRGWLETNGDALVAIAASATPGATIRRDRRGTMHQVRVETVLTQIAHHGTDHRSQIVGTLSQHGIEAPPLDAWTFGGAVLGDGPI